MTSFETAVDELDELVWECLKQRTYPDEILAEQHVRKYLRRTDRETLFSDLAEVDDGDVHYYLWPHRDTLDDQPIEGAEGEEIYAALRQRYDADEEWDYDEELLESHQISNGRLHLPLDDVVDALEELLEDDLPEGQTPEAIEARDDVIADYLREKSQEELFHELQTHPNSTISSAAKHLDPQLGPRSESTYWTLRLRYCDDRRPIHLRAVSTDLVE